jgi:hypothetical protein
VQASRLGGREVIHVDSLFDQLRELAGEARLTFGVPATSRWAPLGKALPARAPIAWMGFGLPRAARCTFWPPQKRIAGPLAARVPIRALQ